MATTIAEETGPKREAAASSTTVGRERLDDLWQDYRKCGDDEARNRLVEAYQPLIKNIVRRFASRLPRSVDRGDLLTAGSVGLISAIKGFDPDRGVRFESYCELRVKGAVLDELRAQDWLPRPWRHRMELQKRTVERLSSALGRQPTDDEAALEMDMGVREYQVLFGTGLPMAPTGSMSGDDSEDDVGQMLEILPDPSADSPDARLSRQELLEMITQKLSEQEHRIVHLKYFEEWPMREIGKVTGLSESRVCKIHARLIERLRDRFGVNQAD